MKKVQLEELKVDSFVTSMEGDDQVDVKGGTTGGCALASAISATVASVTAITALSYDITKDASAWNCDDPCYCPG